MSQILSSQGKNAPSDPYPHYLVRLATSRFESLQVSRNYLGFKGSDILFPLQPPPLPIPTNPPGRPTREGLISVHFGSVRLRSAPFGSVSGLFRVRFGSVSGVLGGVVAGSARGASVREKNITIQGAVAGKLHHKSKGFQGSSLLAKCACKRLLAEDVLLLSSCFHHPRCPKSRGKRDVHCLLQ